MYNLFLQWQIYFQIYFLRLHQEHISCNGHNMKKKTVYINNLKRHYDALIRSRPSLDYGVAQSNPVPCPVHPLEGNITVQSISTAAVFRF